MPDALPEAPWIKGNGTPSDEARANITAGIRRVISGVPKSAEQKAKMSAASKGKPKSMAHRKAMSESHLRRIHGDQI